MKCINCGVSMFDKMLHRTKPKGQPDGGWMCEDCMQKVEPELANNLKTDDDYNVVKAIENIVINDRPLMQSNCIREKCPKCGSIEVDANSPLTIYECDSSDYDQRPNTFKQSTKCKLLTAKDGGKHIAVSSGL